MADEDFQDAIADAVDEFLGINQKPAYSDLCTGYSDGIRCFAFWLEI